MKKVLSLVLLSLVVVLPATAQKKKKNKKKKGETEQVGLTTFNDSLGYAFGVSVANNLLSNLPDSISLSGFVEGFSDSYTKSASAKLTAEQAKSYIAEIVQRLKKLEDADNKEAGTKFLEENGAKEGVITTVSGLQYKVLTKSDSAGLPDITDQVKVHYTGRLLDGTVFDSSVERGQPATFPVNAVIRGWVEALQLMNVGDKFELYIPYDIAYGSRSTGKIPAY